MKYLLIFLLMPSALHAALPDTVTDPATRDALEYLDGKISAAASKFDTWGSPLGSTYTILSVAADDPTKVIRAGDTMTGPLVVQSTVTAYYGIFYDPISAAYPSSTGTGGTITTYVSGGVTYAVHKFTSNGTFTPPANLASVRVLLVGGGGAGGLERDYSYAGGGGAGEVKYIGSHPVASGAYSVVVATVATYRDEQGFVSSFDGITAIGGGRGGDSEANVNPSPDGRTGASGGGGGGGYTVAGGAAGVGTAGNNGGLGAQDNPVGGSGGGGAGWPGGDGAYNYAGNGGDGVYWSITGSPVAYGGGGGGGVNGYITGGLGGVGGGGNSSQVGVANTGGGGGGRSNGSGGGSGIVVISYPINLNPYFDVLVASGNVNVYGDMRVQRGLIVEENSQFGGTVFVSSTITTAKDVVSSGGSLNTAIADLITVQHSSNTVIEISATNGTLGAGTTFYAFTAGTNLQLHKLTATVYEPGTTGTSTFRCGSQANYLDVAVLGSDTIGQRNTTTTEKMIVSGTEVVCLIYSSAADITPTAYLSLQYSPF